MEIFKVLCKSLTAIFIVLCICATIVNITNKTEGSNPTEKFKVFDVVFDTYVVVSIESEGNATQYNVYDQESYIMYRIIESNGTYSIVPIYDSEGNLTKHEIIIQDTIPDGISPSDVI